MRVAKWQEEANHAFYNEFEILGEEWESGLPHFIEAFVDAPGREETSWATSRALAGALPLLHQPA